MHTDPRWTTSSLVPEDSVLQLEEGEAHALRAFSTSQPWRALRRSHVPETLASLSARLGEALDRRCGFAVLRGLPWDGSVEGARASAFAAGLVLGTPVFQDAQASRMVDIRSTDARPLDAATYAPRADGTHVRPYETRLAFRMHADPCDVAGLFCVQAAAAGGSSTVVNALALAERLRATRPDVLRVLEQPFFYAKPRRPGEPASYHAIPVFSWQDGWFKGHIVPDLIYVAQLTPEVPRLSDAQREALEVLMALAGSPEFCHELRLAPGELLLLNNHVVWHGRSAYEDAPETVRHLLRLWIATPSSRPLNAVHAAWFGDCAPGALRGGYLRERLHELA